MRPYTPGDFLRNTVLRQNKHTYRLSCRKGLWSVDSVHLPTLIREAHHYFMQYWTDGEYDT